MEGIDYAPRPKRKTRWWLVGGLIGLIVLFLAVGISVPSFNRPHENDAKAKCCSNLHQIGLAKLLYKNDNNGECPDTFQTILRDEKITSQVFVCPVCNDDAAAGNTTEETIRNFADPKHVSYVYVGAGLTEKTVKESTVIAYDKPGNHGDDGINILFGDGHAEFKDKLTAIKLIPNLSAVSWQQR